MSLLGLGAFTACSRSGDPTPEKPVGAAGDSSRANDLPSNATPVQMAVIQRGTIAISVGGPGRTDARDVQKIRAPFTGTVRMLAVSVGDRVGSGQVVAEIVNQPSQAALMGAEAMLAGATTPAQRSDAERALVLAKQNLVATKLRVSRAGVVTWRGASQGDLVSQGDSIVSIASANSIIFVARLAQSDLSKVRGGQPATVSLPGQVAAVPAIVRGLLPADTNSTMTVPVRIDFVTNLQTAGAAIQPGLFGTARIIVGERIDVPIVPVSAVLRDDISGISRLALVTANGLAHWITVTAGAAQGGNVEITNPALTAGQRVIVSGQVGLPEGAAVRDAGTASGIAR